jgi:PIN domain nuclease of toxin-antitoxin system
LNLPVAVEAAAVPAVYGSGDPGDCFLIATARIRKLALVTRDSRILELAARDPGYLSVIPC